MGRECVIEMCFGGRIDKMSCMLGIGFGFEGIVVNNINEIFVFMAVIL